MEEKSVSKYFNITLAVFLAMVIILSCTVGGNKAADPATYSHTIEVLDKNRSTVLILSAASAADKISSSFCPSGGYLFFYFRRIIRIYFMVYDDSRLYLLRKVSSDPFRNCGLLHPNSYRLWLAPN